MNVFQILAIILSIIQNSAPVLIAAEQAFATGGWAGLVTYLESLLVHPPAGIDGKALEQATADLKARMSKTMASLPPK
jgi:hypothetical protein